MAKSDVLLTRAPLSEDNDPISIIRMGIRILDHYDISKPVASVFNGIVEAVRREDCVAKFREIIDWVRRDITLTT